MPGKEIAVSLAGNRREIGRLLHGVENALSTVQTSLSDAHAELLRAVQGARWDDKGAVVLIKHATGANLGHRLLNLAHAVGLRAQFAPVVAGADNPRRSMGHPLAEEGAGGPDARVGPPLGLVDALEWVDSYPGLGVWTAEAGLFAGADTEQPLANYTVFAAAATRQGAMSHLRQTCEKYVQAVDGLAFSLTTQPRAVSVRQARSLYEAWSASDPLGPPGDPAPRP